MGWYGHVVRKDEGELVKTVRKKPNMGGRSRRGKRIRWRDEVEGNMRKKGLRKKAAEDRQMEEARLGN